MKIPLILILGIVTNINLVIEHNPKKYIQLFGYGLSINIWTILSYYILFQLLLFLVNKIFKKQYEWNIELLTLIFYTISKIVHYSGISSWLYSQQNISGGQLFDHGKMTLFLIILAMQFTSITILVYCYKFLFIKDKIGFGYIFVISIIASLIKSLVDSWLNLSYDGYDSKVLGIVFIYCVFIALIYRYLISSKPKNIL